jgi:hypothetical protein
MKPIDTECRLVAILAADVEGYSRLMGADEVATLQALTERRAFLDGLISVHRGRIANPYFSHGQLLCERDRRIWRRRRGAVALKARLAVRF